MVKHTMGPVACSVCDIPQLVARIKKTLSEGNQTGFSINFINAHLYNLCWKNAELRKLINESDVIAADGMAIVWAARRYGFRLPGRCNMTDSFRAYLADPAPVAAAAILIGGSDAEVVRAAASIQRDGPHLRVVKAISGFLSVDEYAAEVAASPLTNLILLGMGTPKSEQVAARLREIRPGAIIWHIGGGTVMFYAGSLIEAPVWMRKCGLQWLHRLCLEPRRMWRRYVVGNPLFIWRVMRGSLSGIDP